MMRLFCREPHDIERCPPHRFEGGWQNSGDSAPGIIYCRYCGDIRDATPPTIDAPFEESHARQEATDRRTE